MSAVFLKDSVEPKGGLGSPAGPHIERDVLQHVCFFDSVVGLLDVATGVLFGLDYAQEPRCSGREIYVKNACPGVRAVVNGVPKMRYQDIVPVLGNLDTGEKVRWVQMRSYALE
jgi:hypothetical protein